MAIDERLRRELEGLPVHGLDVNRAIDAAVGAGRRRVRRRRRAASSAAVLAVAVIVFGAVLVRLNGPRHASVSAGMGAGAWKTMAAAPIAGRAGHSLVWTGREVLVWGGVGRGAVVGTVTAKDSSFADGAAYDPASDSWRSLPAAPIPGRGYHGATWTGTEMVVWGGADAKGNGLTDGAAYDPATDRWHGIAPSQLSPRLRPVVTWTGSEVLVVGGTTIQPDIVGPTAGSPVPSALMVDGSAYDPATDRWRSISPGPVGESAPWTPAAWTGHDLIVMSAGPAVFAGPNAPPPEAASSGLPIAAYDPATDQWDLLPSVPVSMNSVPWLAWTGSELIAATSSGLDEAGTAVTYDPGSRSWTPLPAPPPGRPRTETAIWTGHEILLAGSNGLSLNPSVPRWRELPPLDTPGGLEEMKVVWTGEALVAWGGFDSGRQDWGEGAVYSPGG